ncbi:MAG: hypothetical protein J5I93_15345 [Pirellulaceae bacterium]|nr:hypothetical protein [Pirellulaceae bacterium]
MSKPILRVDLGKNARDFVAVSLNDLPLLDKNNANDRKVRKALGRLAAQPERRADWISFFVCDEAGGRPHDVICEPASERELRTNSDLKGDLQQLEERLKQVESDELRTTLLRHFKDVCGSSPAHQACSFCKWKTPGGVWRLVWLWGFQRKDLEPAPPIICTNPNCHTLFAKRAADPHCPACKGAAVPPKPEPGRKTAGDAPRRGRRLLLATLGGATLLALLALAAFLVGRGVAPSPEPPVPEAAPRLLVEPADWTGPVGARIQFTARLKDQDVTSQVVARSDAPRVARFGTALPVALARSPGKTLVKFHLGDQSAEATVNVQPPRNPQRLRIEPDDVRLGVGTTTRLQLVGEYEGGAEADLTESAHWVLASRNVFVHRGLLEGLLAGEASVQAMYRADAAQPWLHAEAAVVVEQHEYEALSVSLERPELAAGQATGIVVEAVGKDGQRFPVFGSSKLRLSVEPAHLARIEEGLLQALSPGSARLLADFAGLQAEAVFQVAAGADGAVFEVAPGSLELAVGETAELQVTTSSSSPVSFTSSAPHVVEVTDQGRLLARAPGQDVVITVVQAANQAEVLVDVTRQLFRGLAIVPERMSVAVDQTVPIRLVGTTDTGQMVDLAAEQVQAERLPSSDYLEFDPAALHVRGIRVTDQTPQRLVLRVGDQRASAEIHVVSAPLQLEITPQGAVDVPVGRPVRFQVWASYGDGRRVELLPDRLDWELTPQPSDANAPPMVAFDTTTATASAPSADAGPVRITARFQDAVAGPVTLRAVAAPSQRLEIVADRTPLLVGETGQFRAELVGDDGLRVPAQRVQFGSRDRQKLQVAAATGAFTALAAGPVKVAARLASDPQTVIDQDFDIVDRDAGQLVLRPAELRLPVGGQAELQLVLVTEQGERVIPLDGSAPVALASSHSDAVDWRPPVLAGVSRTARPFELAATWQGRTATSLVEVVAADPAAGPPQLRIVAETTSLVPGQPVTLRVEQQGTPTGGSWVEIQPELVDWTFPAGDVVWTAPSDGLRPSLALHEDSPEQVELAARFQGATASLTVTKASASEAPAATSASQLIVEREPPGETLAVSQQQRYRILVDTGSGPRPAAQVTWLPAFENDYVVWDPPVLSARQGGHVQRLSASVDGQTVSFETRIVGLAPELAEQLPPTEEKPARLRITSGGVTDIQVLLGADFTSFQVEAEFTSGAVRDVTREAELQVESRDPQLAVAVSAGRITGLRIGTAVVRASYRTVASEGGLAVGVVPPTAATALQLEPSALQLVVGETARLRALAFVGEGDARQPLGDATRAAGLTWESQQAEVASVAGPAVTAVQEGSTSILARLGSVTAAADVTVRPADAASAEELRVVPGSLALAVGESREIGADIQVRRGPLDVSADVRAASSDANTIRVDEEGRSLIGVSPGSARVAFTYGGQRAMLDVSVAAAAEPAGELRIVMEPSSGLLAIGESRQVRVYAVDAAGGRTDRTHSALIESSDPHVLDVQASTLTGRGAGQATLSASLPEQPSPATAVFTVEDSAIDQIAVYPNPLRLAPGEELPMRVEGKGSGGWRDISDHAGLKFNAAGDNPPTVEVRGNRVRGLLPGNATISVSLGSAAQQVAVEVIAQPWSDLRIEPAELAVDVGQQASFQVFARRGNRQQTLSLADGLEVRLSDPTPVRLGAPLTIVGAQPGFSVLTVRLQDQQAEARITVQASDRPEPPATPPILPPGLRFVPDVLTLQLGTPGASVRVVLVGADGSEQDVDHRAEMAFDGPQDVVEMRWTASGAVFKPLQVGATRVTATYQGVPTRRPLAVRVVDSAAQPRLEVRPNPVTLAVGQRQDFPSVRILPGRGAAAADTDYRVVTSDPAVVEVLNNRTLRGVAEGETTVRVTPANVDARFQDVAVTVPVRVTADPSAPGAGGEPGASGAPGAGGEPAEPGGGGSSPAARELVLRGPSRTTVGAEVPFTIELVTGSGATDVTNDGAALVVNRDQAGHVSLLPGGIVAGNKAGTVQLTARYENLVSEPRTLRIDPVAQQFAGLEIEVDSRHPLHPQETRPLKVWGIPAAAAGGSSGDRQDLTSLIGQAEGALSVNVVLSPAAGVVALGPQQVTGLAPGRCTLEAVLNQGATSVRSRPVDLEVAEAGGQDSGVLSVEPAAISVHVGQDAPPVRVLARFPGDAAARELEVALASADESVLRPNGSGGFVGVQIGRTQLVARHLGQTVTVEATVVGNPFEKVTPTITGTLGGPLNVSIAIVGSVPGQSYRAVLKDGTSTAWVPATAAGPGAFAATVVSPSLASMDAATVHTVIVESRSAEGGPSERYPCSFRLTLGIEEVTP